MPSTTLSLKNDKTKIDYYCSLLRALRDMSHPSEPKWLAIILMSTALCGRGKLVSRDGDLAIEDGVDRNLSWDSKPSSIPQSIPRGRLESERKKRGKAGNKGEFTRYHYVSQMLTFFP